MVARPDPKWGETPLAFVELKPRRRRSRAAELIAHCRALLAGYKVPREIRFEAIPKTSTGKIQKFQLRERARSARGDRIGSRSARRLCRTELAPSLGASATRAASSR